MSPSRIAITRGLYFVFGGGGNLCSRIVVGSTSAGTTSNEAEDLPNIEDLDSVEDFLFRVFGDSP